MLKTILVALLPLLIFFSNGSDRSFTKLGSSARQDSGTMEKMIVASGNVAMDLNLTRLNGGIRRARGQQSSTLRFDVNPSSFFKVVAFNGEFRGVMPSMMELTPQKAAVLPGRLNDSYGQLAIESLPWGGQYEVVIRDAQTGFVFFNVEGHVFDYDANSRGLSVQLGRLLLSNEFAAELGRPSDAGALVGQISINANLQPIEITQVVDGEVTQDVLPAGAGATPETGTRPGPDVVVGDLSGLAQFGSASGTQVGLAVGTDSCNYGTVNLNWFANPANDHPVIPQNLYRMSGGATNDAKFEQIGQSSVKHAFTALTLNLCGLGCNGTGGSQLGSGCSDPYGASLNAGPNLGSRAWINPFTGAYPRNDSATTPNNSHTGHTHLGPTHRILTEIADLANTQNPGATYYAEGQYITPHEYVHCQNNPGQCNQYNNVSYRRYIVNGNGPTFSFSAAATTQREKAAIQAWTGATIVEFRPAPGADGIGFVGYKVTNPSPGVYHYEYAVYNQNLDRGVQSFSIPLGNGITLTNVGFHAPPQHPGSALDGTVGSAGFSSTPWATDQSASAITWASETLAQNPNANAIRWGTMYNFRFDSNRPPQAVNATLGFFKSGGPMNVQVQGPSPAAAANVTVAGRVIRANGMGAGSVYVLLIDAGGNARAALTNPFGAYSFDNVATGQTYTIGATSKRYTFPDATMITVTDHITNHDITEIP